PTAANTWQACLSVPWESQWHEARTRLCVVSSVEARHPGSREGRERCFPQIALNRSRVLRAPPSTRVASTKSIALSHLSALRRQVELCIAVSAISSCEGCRRQGITLFD